MRGNEKSVGEDVDLGLLLQSSEDQRVWVEGLRDLVDLSFATMEERETGSGTLLGEEGGFK